MKTQSSNVNIEEGWAAIERKEYEEALSFFEIAANEGCPNGLTCMASMYEDGLGVSVDTERALSLLYRASDLGDPEAQARLGFFNVVGRHMEQNLVAAVEFHKLAAQQGYVLSQCDLGRHYADGIGVQQNLAESQRWYELAAQSGHTLAQHNLASTILIVIRRREYDG